MAEQDRLIELGRASAPPGWDAVDMHEPKRRVVGPSLGHHPAVLGVHDVQPWALFAGRRDDETLGGVGAVNRGLHGGEPTRAHGREGVMKVVVAGLGERPRQATRTHREAFEPLTLGPGGPEWESPQDDGPEERDCRRERAGLLEHGAQGDGPLTPASDGLGQAGAEQSGVGDRRVQPLIEAARRFGRTVAFGRRGVAKDLLREVGEGALIVVEGEVQDGAPSLIGFPGGSHRLIGIPGGSHHLIGIPGGSHHLIGIPGGSHHLIGAAGAWTALPWR